jgi:hypothetical protein
MVRFKKLFPFLCFVAVLIISLRSFFVGRYPDFSVYYYGSQALFLGENPYIHTATSFSNFVYPPFVLLFFSPFLLLSYTSAGFVFLAMSFLSLFVGVYFFLLAIKRFTWSGYFMMLAGGTMRVKPDRNEIVTLAVAAIATGGDIFVKEATEDVLEAFLSPFSEAGGGYEVREDGIRFFYKGPLKAVSVATAPHPGFMTDWQGPWSIMMSLSEGESVIHETVFENRFGYVKELKKMGAKITLFNPKVENPVQTYNFNLSDDHPDFFHAARIQGPVTLHNAVVTISDIRAGATLVLASLAARGVSTILGIEKLDRGYEQLELRLGKLGATIERLEV